MDDLQRPSTETSRDVSVKKCVHPSHACLRVHIFVSHLTVSGSLHLLQKSKT